MAEQAEKLDWSEAAENKSDSSVDHPSHYNTGDIETIDYLESLGIAEDFCAGNAIKYLSRYKHKGKVLEDVKKAKWYVNRLVKILEEQSEQAQKN